MFKKTAIAGLLAAALGSGLAQAQAPAAPASPHTLTGNVGIFSQYIFRGLAQTDRDPAVQGGFDYSHSSGLYAGTWASNISWLQDSGAYTSGGSAEWDFYGGIKGSIGKSDFSYDAGLLYYYYRGTTALGAPRADTLEAYGSLGWKWLSAKFSVSLDDKTFAVRDSRGTWYLDLTATVPLGEFSKPLEGLSFIAHYGRQKYSGTDARNVFGLSNDNLFSYNDYKLGLSYALPKDFTIGAYYTDTSGANRLGYGSVAEGGVFPRNIAKSTGTVYIQKTF
ncbi:MAG: hypothetical protein HYV99_00265 [Betaproteobacteria bacterium]|nr:hypothetical protein [Betaproteobacteria bacterium]MBI2508488.1 hypothetical protein [Betaproteobacteria bacterium]